MLVIKEAVPKCEVVAIAQLQKNVAESLDHYLSYQPSLVLPNKSRQHHPLQTNV